MTPKNWASFQHYKNRSPAWIKLHRSLLDDYEFSRLPVASRALAPCLWLLASEYEEGNITASIEEISFRVRMNVEDLQKAIIPLIERGFFTVASTLLADCKRDASPRREEKRTIIEEKNIGRSQKATRPERDEKFEEFKKEYPKRKGANPWKPAQKKFQEAVRRGVSPDLIISAVKAGVGFDADKIGTEFSPRALTWLSQERYRDYETARAPPKTGWEVGRPTYEQVVERFGQDRAPEFMEKYYGKEWNTTNGNAEKISH